MEKINNISKTISKESCCGCSACESICKKNAISMKLDEQGFLYPVVDNDLCVNCGRCIELCPNSDGIISLDECYAVKRKDKDKLRESASGGFAAALSEKIIAEGGIVYGVAYNSFPHVGVIRVSNNVELDRLKGSKYVQSDPGVSFKQVQNDLQNGLTVAYFNTSCYISGLKKFLYASNTSDANLITIDLICHGVPSPRLFEEYISYFSRKKEIVSFDFRTKFLGWGGGSKNFCPTIYYKKKIKRDTPESWGFIKLFFSNNCLRPFCYHCPYAGNGRVGDFTIADYWDVETVFPDFYTSDGVSLVFSNSEKSKKLINKINGIVLQRTTYGLGMDRQANLKGPSIKAVTYERFWEDYYNGGIREVLKKYASLGYKSLAKYYVKQILSTFGIR